MTTMAVRVQIAGVSSLDEALAAERAGADALGFTLRLPTGVHTGVENPDGTRNLTKIRSFIAPAKGAR